MKIIIYVEDSIKTALMQAADLFEKTKVLAFPYETEAIQAPGETDRAMASRILGHASNMPPNKEFRAVAVRIGSAFAWVDGITAISNGKQWFPLVETS